MNINNNINKLIATFDSLENFSMTDSLYDPQTEKYVTKDNKEAFKRAGKGTSWKAGIEGRWRLHKDRGLVPIQNKINEVTTSVLKNVNKLDPKQLDDIDESLKTLLDKIVNLNDKNVLINAFEEHPGKFTKNKKEFPDYIKNEFFSKVITNVLYMIEQIGHQKSSLKEDNNIKSYKINNDNSDIIEKEEEKIEEEDNIIIIGNPVIEYPNPPLPNPPLIKEEEKIVKKDSPPISPKRQKSPPPSPQKSDEIRDGDLRMPRKKEHSLKKEIGEKMEIIPPPPPLPPPPIKRSKENENIIIIKEEKKDVEKEGSKIKIEDPMDDIRKGLFTKFKHAQKEEKIKVKKPAKEKIEFESKEVIEPKFSPNVPPPPPPSSSPPRSKKTNVNIGDLHEQIKKHSKNTLKHVDKLEKVPKKIVGEGDIIVTKLQEKIANIKDSSESDSDADSDWD